MQIYAARNAFFRVDRAPARIDAMMRRTAGGQTKKEARGNARGRLRAPKGYGERRDGTDA